MKHRKPFVVGIALLAIYGVYNFRFALPFHSYIFPFHGDGLSTLLDFLLYDSVFGPMVGRLSAIFGFMLLASHYYHADAKERLLYRYLDRLSALFLGAFAGLLLIIIGLSIRAPSPHIGIMLIVQLGFSLLLLTAAMLWAYALWRARAGMALLFSVLCVALIFAPEIPYNNPRYWDESEAYWQQQDANVETEHTLSVESDDTITVDYTQTVIYEERLDLLAPLLLLTYTWMRWVGVYNRDDDRVAEEA